MSSSEYLQPLRIRVGDVFEVNNKGLWHPKPNQVIIGLKEDDCTCFSASFYVTTTGEEAVDPISRGGVSRERILRIVGRWDPERLPRAAKAGYYDSHIGRLWEIKARESFMKELQKPPILLR